MYDVVNDPMDPEELRIENAARKKYEVKILFES
jgi:hypothetical protein